MFTILNFTTINFTTMMKFIYFLLFGYASSLPPTIKINDDDLPYFHGNPVSHIPVYPNDIIFAPHEVYGDGLHNASVGISSSFNIQLKDNDIPHDLWNTDHDQFIYVWIANEDQIFIAEVVNVGNGKLTATYKSSFPGEYKIYVEVVKLGKTKDQARSQGVPIVGSPFDLVIEGEPFFDVNTLPVCGTSEDSSNIEESFWRTGSWISSNIASEKHGVSSDGWVFQPETCVYDTFSYEDLIILSENKDPIWILILGNSIQRGVFLTMIDMLLNEEQKGNFKKSILSKCWGYAEVTVGNLRITFQDFRTYSASSNDDVTICNDEKLLIDSSSGFIRSAKDFLENIVFKEGGDWPTLIFSPSYVTNDEENTNVTVDTLMDSLPYNWEGKVVMAQHMSGFGFFHYLENNPTRKYIDDIGFINTINVNTYEKNIISKIEYYQREDDRVSFMSVFPMYQSKLFESEFTRGNDHTYGASIHFHSFSTFDHTYNGSKMVTSTMTEMISNILFTNLVVSKEFFYSKNKNVDFVKPNMFNICTDCPSSLFPIHIKSSPNITCEYVSGIKEHLEAAGPAWDKTMCPSWCMDKEPDSQLPMGNGKFIDVRNCQ